MIFGMSTIIGESGVVAVAPTVVANVGSYDSVNEEVDLFGNVTNDGGGTITERGFYYAVNDSSINNTNNKVVVSGTTGSYSTSVPVVLLPSSSTFYYRAFATNSAGESLSPATISVSLPSNLKLKL